MDYDIGIRLDLINQKLDFLINTLQLEEKQRGWHKEHYNIDYANQREVTRKRKVPARNVKRKTTRKR